jgi:mRNA-degrading endonuclease toxin of MazEF toxin-antitoxin module
LELQRTAKLGNLLRMSERSPMVDKIQTVSRKRIGARIGRLEDEPLLAVNRALALFLGLTE